MVAAPCCAVRAISCHDARIAALQLGPERCRKIFTARNLMEAIRWMDKIVHDLLNQQHTVVRD